MTAYDDGVLALASPPDYFWPADDASGDLAEASGGTALTTNTDPDTYQDTGPTINGEAQSCVTGTAMDLQAVGTSAVDNSISSFMVAGWFKTSTDNQYVMGRKGQGDDGGWVSYIDASPETFLLVYNDNAGTTYGSAGDATDYSDGSWHFFCGWVDASGNVHVQIDGGTVYDDNSPSGSYGNDPTEDFEFGASLNGSLCKIMWWLSDPGDDVRSAIYSGVFATLHAVSPTDDVTTTGWSSTPLWSKIDEDPDSPDGTVITATAS